MNRKLTFVLVGVLFVAGLAFGMVQAHSNAKKQQRALVEQEMSFALGLIDGFTQECSNLGLLDTNDWQAGFAVMHHMFKEKQPKSIEDLEGMFKGMDYEDTKKIRKELGL